MPCKAGGAHETLKSYGSVTESLHVCRLFGFKAKTQATIHNSMVAAENALLHQSGFHSDGWGIAYYQQGCPHLIKSPSSAFEDHLFARLSQRITSETVVAHLRKSTLGRVAATNTHPFQYGRWIFAHNGNIRHFSKLESSICREVCSPFCEYRLGATDSELIFYFLLARLHEKGLVESVGAASEDVVTELSQALTELQKIIGPHSRTDGPCDQTYLSFILTDGDLFFAYQGGKPLFYNLGEDFRTVGRPSPGPLKTPSFQAEMLEVSSEPTGTAGYWRALEPGECIAIDSSMKCTVARIG